MVSKFALSTSTSYGEIIYLGISMFIEILESILYVIYINKTLVCLFFKGQICKILKLHWSKVDLYKQSLAQIIKDL